MHTCLFSSLLNLYTSSLPLPTTVFPSLSLTYTHTHRSHHDVQLHNFLDPPVVSFPT